jgi:hypothetical protein
VWTNIVRRDGTERAVLLGRHARTIKTGALRTDGKIDGNEDLMVDGNALVGGVLNEVLVREMTDARVKCEGCGEVWRRQSPLIDFNE